MKPKLSVRRALVLIAVSIYVPTIQVGRSAPNTATPAEASSPGRGERLSFYEVPLVCPAAPQIGCGSASKPLLLGLEGTGVASEAWLNRAGTVVAILWSEQSTAQQRAKALKSILEQAQIEGKELTGDARRKALDSFQQQSGWYRGAQVDRLSEEEAGVIAARLVRRIRARITVTDDNANAIEQGFTAVLKQKLTGKSTKSDTQEAMINICRQRLSQKDVTILQEAFAAGACAINDEK